LAEYRPAPNTAQGTPLSPPQDVPQVEVRSQDEIGELSQAFNQMARSLAQQEMLRRNLMADIAHELRTPLTILRSDLEALLDGVYEPTPEALASLHEETLLLSRLVDDLRALAQAEAGQLRLECQSTDLLELLRGVVTSFDLQAENDGIALALDLPASLPAVQVDPQRLHQVVANLVSNALRHARAVPAVDHGPTARQPAPGQVIVAATQHSDYVQVSVSDNGPGIRSEDVPHVFDRFWRGDWVATPRSPEESKTSASKARGSTSRRSGRSEEYLPESQDFVRSGSGLGLAIAQELVQAHGGRIWAESVPGQGATLHFTLPVRPTG
jgi:signal transduction histidine kinase